MPGWEGYVLVAGTRPAPSSLPMPWGPPFASLQGGKGQYKWEASAQKETGNSQEQSLGTSQAGAGPSGEAGLGHRAGPSRLEKPVYSLLGVGLCSRGGASNWSQENTDSEVLKLRTLSDTHVQSSPTGGRWGLEKGRYLPTGTEEGGRSWA